MQNDSRLTQNNSEMLFNAGIRKLVIASIFTKLHLTNDLSVLDIHCSDVNLAGRWTTLLTPVDSSEAQRIGEAKILQDSCSFYFHVSGNIVLDDGTPYDFTMPLARIQDDVIWTVYQSFAGELGVGKGVISSAQVDSFTLMLYDAADFDKDGKTNSRFDFIRAKE